MIVLLRRCSSGNATYQEEERERNFEGAIGLFRKAIEQGNTDALVELGKCFQGSMGVEWGWKVAVRLFQGTADEGNADGEGELGYCYWQGRRTLQSFNYSILRSAVSKGQWNACTHLGWCYERSLGVDKNAEQAYLLFVAFCRK